MIKMQKTSQSTQHPLSVWDFISIVSHQLRNPLASTRLSLEMILGGDLGPLTSDQEEYLRMLYNDNERMIQLVKDFLTLSAIERGDIKLNPQPLDLKGLTEEVIQELTAFAAAHNTKISYTAPEKLPLVIGDKLKLIQVITNIIDNAIKYTRPGGTITITLSADTKEIKFEIKDKGIGIPEKDKNEIFTKFYRASNAGAVHPEGTGIGLYIAKAIVEKSEGQIDFTSKENEGSTFWFTLPISSAKR